MILQKTYPEALRFVKLSKKGQFQSTLVYSSTIELDMLVFDVGMTLRNIIQESSNQATFNGHQLHAIGFRNRAIKLPAMARLEEADVNLPNDLVKFLCYVSLEESSKLLTSQIVKNPTGETLFHSDFTISTRTRKQHQSILPMVSCSRKLKL